MHRLNNSELFHIMRPHYPELNHIGIATPDAEAFARMIQALLGRLPYARETIPSQHLEATFIGVNHAKLELLQPLAPESPIARFLQKRGEGVHHLAFEVQDIYETYRYVQNLGYTPVNEPSLGAQGKWVFFLHPKETHGVLIEFCQKPSIPLTPTAYWEYQQVSIAVYQAGNPQNPAVLLLHGALGSVAMELRSLFQALAPDYFVTALDLPGHGHSDPLPDTSSPHFMVESINHWLQSQEITHWNLFGFSLGGHLALRIAQHLPDHISTLALYATHSLHEPVLQQRVLERLNPEHIAQQPEQLQLLEQYHQADWKKTAGWLQHHLNHPEAPIAPEALRQILHPTLIAGGDRDPLFPPEATIAFARLFKHAQILILPGATHSLETVPSAHLLPFLRSHFK